MELKQGKVPRSLISNTLGEMLNKQKDSELYNHDLYKEMASYFKGEGLHKLANYYYKRGEEEKHHHDWIVTRLRECNYPIEYVSKPRITQTWNDRFKPFELTVLVELDTTRQINEIVARALEEHDYKIVYWLFDTLINEQHEEEFLSKTIMDIANQDTDWLTKEDTIEEFYKRVQKNMNRP